MSSSDATVWSRFLPQPFDETGTFKFASSQIVELAEFLTRNSGKEIPITFTGLRPGDKLTEELTDKAEERNGFVEGPLEVIKTCRLGRSEAEDVIEKLSGCVATCDGSGLIRMVSSVIPEHVHAMGRAAGV
jgi:FlaA1/EpsC-like NDP-sugar epimerase